MPITDLSYIIPQNQIDPAMATEAEFKAADAAHVAAANPHPQYLLSQEGDTKYRQTSATQIFNSTIKNIGLSSGIIGTVPSASNQTGIEVQASNTASAAFMSFHRPGIYGLHMGLDINNQLCVGGWSMGQTSHRLLHEGIPVTVKGGVAPPTAAVAGNSVVITWNSIQVGLGVAEIVNYAGLGGGDTCAIYRLPGSEDRPPTISNRVSRIDMGGAYIQTSDRRVKSDFTHSPGLEALLQLNPVKYKHWACEGFDEEKREVKLGESFSFKIGFVAQEVQKVLGEAVSVPSSPEELWGIDYNCLLACAVKALQESHQQLQEQQKQIAAITQQIAELRARLDHLNQVIA